MSAIIEDFADILPYLDGRRYDKDMCIRYTAPSAVKYRNDVLVEMCRGKRVLHIGCCDHVPVIADKIRKRDWIQGLITECSQYTVGIDIDAEAVEQASRISGLDNMFAGDITADYMIDEIADKYFDVVLFAEVLEHIPNPASFLSAFRERYGASVGSIIITVPNAFRGGNVKGVFRNIETINSDHRFFFTPYTIAKIAFDAGYAPIQIQMATFTPAGRYKTMLLNHNPLLAEVIIFVGTAQAGDRSLPASELAS